MLDGWTLGVWLSLGGAIVAWLVSVTGWVVASVRRSGRARALLGAGALLHLLAGPAAFVAAYLRMASHARMFGAERVALDWLGQIAPGALVGWGALAVASLLLAASARAAPR
ncbi:MAG TPA: hypothetical protein RMH99_01370 [Sandaracinaceae bacterium LLY-WYZ-13_1]|nr:hypothetical protein [Sandaracinaceae bacterium LLY-WYZ-13_1]